MKSVDCGPCEKDVYTTILRSLSVSYDNPGQTFHMSLNQFKFSDLVGNLIALEVRKVLKKKT